MYSSYTVVLFHKNDLRTWQKSASEVFVTFHSVLCIISNSNDRRKNNKKNYKRYFQVNFQ